MVEMTQHNLRLSVAAAVIRQLAASEPSDADDLRRAVLRLAAALVQLADTNRPGRTDASAPGSPGAEKALAEWCTRCSGVLAAMAYPLQDLGPALAGEPPHTDTDSFADLAQRLAEQAGQTVDSLNGACGALRSQGGRLLQRASQLGATARSAQLERLRLADDLRQLEVLEKQYAALGVERAAAADRMASLQERLRLAESTPERCRELEKEVDRHETLAGELRSRLKELEQTREDQEADKASLGDRIRQTEQLIEELRRSPDEALLRTVEAIWRAVGDHHSHRT
jgi:hypothetical protein